MGFFKLFEKKKKVKVVEEDQEVTPPPISINPEATMIQNEIICNGCGEVIIGTPKIFNFNGRRMLFHKGCYKKLRSGNINL